MLKKVVKKKYRYKSYDFIVKEDYNENDNKIIIFIGKKVKCLLGILDYNKNLKNTSRTIILHSFVAKISLINNAFIYNILYIYIFI